MSLIKDVWYVLRVENIQPGSPSDPNVTATAEAKPRYVYTIDPNVTAAAEAKPRYVYTILK